MDEKETQPNNQGVNLKTLRTYTSDMADAVRENEISVIKIAVAEQQQQHYTNRNTMISKYTFTSHLQNFFTTIE